MLRHHRLFQISFVEGYIDRGNELGRDEEKNFNAFCPITRLIELIERQKN